MGIFRRSNSRSSESSQIKESLKMQKALDFFVTENIECDSCADESAIKMLYEALKENNYDTADDLTLVEAISSLDANLYHLCQALIYQNFMLMRKIDELSKQINNTAKL